MAGKTSAYVGRDGLIRIKGPWGGVRTLFSDETRDIVPGGEGGRTAANSAVRIINTEAKSLEKKHQTPDADTILDHVTPAKGKRSESE
jgi:hypothetical protein